MQRTIRVMGVMALGLTLTGCWDQPDFDAGRSNWNSGETTITATNVDDVELLWETTVAGVPRVSHGGTVYVADGETASALDARTGAVRWTTNLHEELDPEGLPFDFFFLNRPTYVNDELLVPWTGITSGRTQGDHARLDARTGAIVGQTGGIPNGPGAVAGGQLVPSSISAVPIQNFAIYWIGWTYSPGVVTTLRPDDPRPGSNFAIVGERVAWSRGTSALGFSSACPSDPEPPVGSGLCGPDWTVALPGTPTDIAAVDDQTVAYTDDTGALTVLDMATGDLVWSSDLGESADALTVARGTVFAVVDHHRHVAFPPSCGAPTCSALWEANTGESGPSGLVAAGDVVYVGGQGGIKAFTRDGCGQPTCDPLATFSLGVAMAPAVVDDGRILGATTDGRVVAFGLASRSG